MIKILNIIPIKRKKQLVLELDNNSSYKILQDTIIEFNLYPGRELSEKELDSILKFDGIKQVKEQAVRYLARRIHSSRELFDKLLRKGFPEEIINEVIDDLKEKKYLNDDEFLKMFIQDRLNFSKKGRNIIIKELLMKGFPKEKIEAVLFEFLIPEEELEKATTIAKKKWKFHHKKGKNDRIIKVKQHLLQKGYPVSIAEKAILKVMESL